MGMRAESTGIRAAALLAMALVLANPARADILQPLGGGESLVYGLIGVQNDESADDETATIIHCTNVAPDAVIVTVQIFASNGFAFGPSIRTLDPGETETWVTQPTFLSVGLPISVSSFTDHGSARIVALGKKPQLLCAAWIVDPDTGLDGETTTYMNLPVVPLAKPISKIKTPTPPIDPDRTLIYATTGVVNDTAGGDEMATVFVCTNVGESTAGVSFQIFDSAGTLVDSLRGGAFPGETFAVATQKVETVSTDNLGTPQILDAGSARILVEGDGKPKVICNAYVIDPDATEATAALMLPLTRIGKPPKVSVPGR